MRLIIIFCITSFISGKFIFKKSRCPSESMNECVWRDNEYVAVRIFCYKGLGCFKNGPPWFTTLRPVPPPDPPAIIDVQIYLKTRSYPKHHIVQLWPYVDMDGLDFDKYCKTVFIIHGHSSGGNVPWISNMAKAYLSQVEANVFVIDWITGAKKPYLQTMSNTRIVGAELSRFIRYLEDEYNIDLSNIHLIGHSLGAHIAAYAAKANKGIGRITALDPAQPGFENNIEKIRLAKGDANFIEVVHTNARPFIPHLGLGIMKPLGDVDFYMNNGAVQPGCETPKKSVNSDKEVTIRDLGVWFACSHSRSHEYFTASLESYCSFIGIRTTVTHTESGITFGDLQVPTVDLCTPDSCIPLSLETPLYTARGSFVINTTSTYPYC